jgi:formiminotetrahydrofolate cyclodeaminase
MWDDPGPVNLPQIDDLLDAFASTAPAPAAGTAAAYAGAMAAAVCVKLGEPGERAQADALRGRLVKLAVEDARVFTVALQHLRDPADDWSLERALAEAADVPLRITEACADVSALAHALAETGSPERAADARAVAALAAGAARAAAALVEANLLATPDDERVRRAQRRAEEAARR